MLLLASDSIAEDPVSLQEDDRCESIGNFCPP